MRQRPIIERIETRSVFAAQNLSLISINLTLKLNVPLPRVFGRHLLNAVRPALESPSNSQLDDIDGRVDALEVILSALLLDVLLGRDVEVVEYSRGMLREMIIRKNSSDHARLKVTLTDYALDPDTYEKPAKKVLHEAGVDHDQEVIDYATELLNGRRLPSRE